MPRFATLFLAVALLTACGSPRHSPASGPPPVTRQVLSAVGQLSRSRAPAFTLGTRYRGLTLVHVEVAQFFTSSLWYADCTWLELNSLSPACHRSISIDNDRPTPGEATTQGRCRFKGVVRGATVASFPVNPHTLRVFMADATVYVSADTLRDRLAAVRALRALNRPVGEHDRFRPRNLLALLGRCRAAKPAKPRPPLTAKERYEARMKRSFLIESLGLAGIVVPPTAANPGALAHEFLVDSANIPPLARNEADRIDAIDPPDAVADVQHTLARELRTYADDVDRARDAVSRGDWHDVKGWDTERPELEARLRRDIQAALGTVGVFKRRGYSIYVPPSD